MLTARDLIEAGMKPGKWIPAALHAANAVLAGGGTRDAALSSARACEPLPLAQHAPGTTPFFLNIAAETPEEEANVALCTASMTELMRTPVVMAGALMPDASPAGPNGTIPVGGIAASRAIHPGMHSSDICCAMALSVLPGVDPKALLDAVEAVTHFGPGARSENRRVPLPAALAERFAANAMLKPMVAENGPALSNFATQGDGNHFAYVGRLKSTGETTLVTHHGSRGPGAALYKTGIALAERHRAQVSPRTLPQNAWIEADTAQGDLYWEALQVLRHWTKASHFAIHDLAAAKLSARVADRFWNEHNFVFRKTDGLFYHGKGATPAFPGWAADAGDLTIIPLNMAEPILIARGRNAPHGLGFSPHGAGRNFSRTRHKKSLGDRAAADVFREETSGLDARFYLGVVDVSELPSAYKKAATVRRQIEHFGLADIVDEVLPYGSIMAGDWEQNAPWRKRKRADESRA